MRIPRIHTAQPLVANSSITLESTPSQHIARALRMQVGDALVLFNGEGGEFPAQITALGKRQVVVETGRLADTELESKLRIHLGIAISRGDRMDWIVQKSTELGVAAITPLFTSRTEVKLAAERADKKLQHWRAVAISACEQCGRNRVPALNQAQQLSAWLVDTRADRKFVLHHRAWEAQASAAPPTTVALLIGPEGGLAPAEIESAEHAGYEPLRLGPRILRTETAPLASIAILQACWGDMSTPW